MNDFFPVYGVHTLLEIWNFTDRVSQVGYVNSSIGISHFIPFPSFRCTKFFLHTWKVMWTSHEKPARAKKSISASWHHRQYYVNRLSIKTRAQVCESDENLHILRNYKRFMKLISHFPCTFNCNLNIFLCACWGR